MMTAVILDDDGLWMMTAGWHPDVTVPPLRGVWRLPISGPQRPRILVTQVDCGQTSAPLHFDSQGRLLFWPLHGDV
jgi:hypothetical protein